MNKYVVAITSLYDYEQKLSVVEADSELQALDKAMKAENPDWDFSECEQTIEGYCEEAFNGDTLIGVLKI